MSKQFLKIFCISLILSSFFLTSIAYAARIIPDQDLIYLGAFKVPNSGQVNSYWGYTRGFITFNPSGDGGNGSIIGTGLATKGYVSEISIPMPKIDTLANLNRATTLQPFTEIRGGLEDDQIPDVHQTTYGLTIMPRQTSQTSDKLYWVSIYDYMPSSDTSGLTLGYSSLDFTNLNAQGKWNLNGYSSNKGAEYSWYALTLPKTWTDANGLAGKYLGLGRARQNAAGGQGYGPSLYAAEVSTSDSGPAYGSQLAATKLLGYPSTNPMDRNYAHSDGVPGAAFLQIGNKNALAFTYVKGIKSARGGQGDYPYEDYKYPSCSSNEFCWPEASTYNSSASDYKSGPWIGALGFIDADDLAAVAAGSKQPHEIKPYAIYQIEKYLKRPKGAVGSAEWSTNKILGGIAYDSVHQKIYVEELEVEGSHLPIIHVFQLQDNGSGLDISTPPSVPTNIQNNAAVVTWNPSSDSHGDNSKINYVIFKWFNQFTSPVTTTCESSIGGVKNAQNQCVYPAMWRPIANTTATTWTDPAYAVGDTYNVTAYDAYMQPSNILNTAVDTAAPVAPSGLSVV